jgi:two-component system C4-dicarboxylate transport sensor histidine kinase DctB
VECALIQPIRHLSLVFFVLYVIITTLGANIVWTYRYQALLDDHQSQLDRFSSHIVARLDKYAHLPQLLSRDRKLIDALLSPTNPAQIDVTNRYLEQVNSTIKASDTYLLNSSATTIAASNWNLDRSFVGRNFSWRPYFTKALAGENSQYYALGSTSAQRGYYYSAPVIYAADTLGVVVVKMDLSSIEESWQSDTSYFVATDPNGIIFMSNQAKWLFKSITPLSQTTQDHVIRSKQYLNRTIDSLNLSGNMHSTNSEWINPKSGWINGDFIVTSRSLPDVALTIRVLTPKITVFWGSVTFVVWCTMAFAIAYLVLLLIHHRRLKQRQFEQLESEAKQKLEFLVLERTAKLHAEIKERSKTEEQLRKTQDELIQAAKLAVLGQMSASISHELNNPLAAIRSFADNGRRFLSAGKHERTDDNLQRISALTERMAKISTQLKSFARKSDGDEKIQVQLKPLVLSAKELMLGQFKASFVDFSVHMIDRPIWLTVNPIQLEQVLINLLSNAIQATTKKEQNKNEQKEVQLSIEYEAPWVLIHIDDNGAGIMTEKLDRLFEPFFTTKKNGLGLGLSISQQIVHSMNGEIVVNSSPLGGARFTLRLPTSSAPNE